MSLFHSAAQAVVDGNLAALHAYLSRTDAGLTSARSPQHGATLLHYVSANGPVEGNMQKTPANAVEIAQFLIENGSYVDATIEGGDAATTPLVGLVTSGECSCAGRFAR